MVIWRFLGKLKSGSGEGSTPKAGYSVGAIVGEEDGVVFYITDCKLRSTIVE